MKYKLTYLLISALITWFAVAPQKEQADFKLITNKNEFEAGSEIVLKFNTSSSETPNLYLSNSYGSSLIVPQLESGVLTYVFPETFANKSGKIFWKLLSENHSVFGALNVTPKLELNTMESYIGPPSIAVGGNYAMLVVIPTDVFDNPLPDSTKVNVKHQFLSTQSNEGVFVNNSIAYKNIFSENEAGRILIASECLGKNSKEYTIDAFPDIPKNFTITYNRNHDFADANQITTFTTSVIKDTYGNTVSDGTYVEFFIKNNEANILKTFGTTINGIATAKMIHPNHKESWTVKAIIDGMAESGFITLSYKQVISDFKVHFSEDNRTVTVGPLKSFMDQLTPDGLEVSLSVYKGDNKLKTLTKTSFEGFSVFKLSNNNFPVDTYTFKIELAGIQKNFTNVKL